MSLHEKRDFDSTRYGICRRLYCCRRLSGRESLTSPGFLSVTLVTDATVRVTAKQAKPLPLTQSLETAA